MCLKRARGAMAWITRLTTDQKIPGSNPGELVAFSSTGVQENKLNEKYVRILASSCFSLCMCTANQIVVDLREEESFS